MLEIEKEIDIFHFVLLTFGDTSPSTHHGRLSHASDKTKMTAKPKLQW